jgi:hypothetical protein
VLTKEKFFAILQKIETAYTDLQNAYPKGQMSPEGCQASWKLTEASLLLRLALEMDVTPEPTMKTKLQPKRGGLELFSRENKGGPLP